MDNAARSHQAKKGKYANFDQTQEVMKQGDAEESKANLSLLRIPRETRHQILRDLLFHPEPLRQEYHQEEGSEPARKTKNFTFYPEILRVCRQMFSEGIDILYKENTMEIQLKFDEEVARSHILGYDFLKQSGMQADEAQRTVEALRKRMKKWKIVLEVEERQNLREVRDLVRDCCIMWSKMPKLLHLTISIEDRGTQTEGTEDSRAEEIFRPFRLLRELGHVDFIGVGISDIEETRELMRSSQPVVDLPMMFMVFDDYVEKFAPDDSSIEQGVHDARNAMDQHDEPTFSGLREWVLERVREHVHEEEGRVFRYDPVQGSSGNLEG